MPSKTKSAAADPLFRDIARRFWDGMREVGLTQTALAKETKVPQPALSQFLRAEKGLETRRLLRVFSAGARHGIQIDAVFSGTGPLSASVHSDDAAMGKLLLRVGEQLVARERAPEDDGPASKSPRPAHKRRKA